jgi:hypothetical protein
MLTVVMILLIANLGGLVWLIRRQIRHGQELAALAATAQKLAPLRAGVPDDLARTLESSRSTLISIEILNPMELASKQSRFARAFGSMTPALIRREVYRQARDMIDVQLREHGVEPRVTLHHGR